MFQVPKVSHANTTLTSQTHISVKHALPNRRSLFIKNVNLPP